MTFHIGCDIGCVNIPLPWDRHKFLDPGFWLASIVMGLPLGSFHSWVSNFPLWRVPFVAGGQMCLILLQALSWEPLKITGNCGVCTTLCWGREWALSQHWAQDLTATDMNEAVLSETNYVHTSYSRWLITRVSDVANAIYLAPVHCFEGSAKVFILLFNMFIQNIIHNKSRYLIISTY